MRLDADIPGCEPLPALLARVHAALHDLAGLDGPVLVVAHNGSLRAALALLVTKKLEAVVATSLEHLRPIEVDLDAAASPRVARLRPEGLRADALEGPR